MDWLKKKKKKKENQKQWLVQVRERGAILLEDLIECCDGKSNPIKFFSADQIITATNNFSDSNRGPAMDHFWSYWSGTLDNHRIILVSYRHRNNYTRQYCRNIAISSMVSGHKNFMKLLGCCLELEDLVIVYNFIEIPSYSLDLKMVVSWKRRIKIAEEIAIALAYLHTAFPRPFVYRKMSLDSILLDEDGVARLCDFSCCISIPQGETFVQVDSLAGTVGFIDKNYMHTRTVSEKTDVYAIGILMQMLLTGKERFYKFPEKHQDDRRFGSWLIRYKEELRMDEIADPEILEKMDEVGEEELCQMDAFLMLSLRFTGCTNWEIPNMVEVAKELKNIQRSSFPSSASGEIIIGYPQDISFPSSASGESDIIIGKEEQDEIISSSSSFSSFSSYEYGR